MKTSEVWRWQAFDIEAVERHFPHMISPVESMKRLITGIIAAFMLSSCPLNSGTSATAATSIPPTARPKITLTPPSPMPAVIANQGLHSPLRPPRQHPHRIDSSANDNGVRVIIIGATTIDNGTRAIAIGAIAVDNGMYAIDYGANTIDNGACVIANGVSANRTGFDL